jgi:hypothetical protein
VHGDFSCFLAVIQQPFIARLAELAEFLLAATCWPGISAQAETSSCRHWPAQENSGYVRRLLKREQPEFAGS